jgi:hypothetical protein
MKGFISKVQTLGQKAAQIKEAIESVPPRIQEARSVVLATAGELQQLREDVQSSVMSLRTEDQNRLVTSLREIDASADIFREAGYVLQTVEMEIGFIYRLIVQLKKVADVPHDSMKVLVLENAERRTVHAILTALIKAEELSDGVNLSQLEYRRLSVYVGPTPSVRLCWSTEADLEPAPNPADVLASAAPAGAAAAQPQPVSFPSSFFERRPAVTAIAPVVPAQDNTLAPAPVAVAFPASLPLAATAPAEPGDWRRDALARFKKMPDLTKRR